MSYLSLVYTSDWQDRYKLIRCQESEKYWTDAVVKVDVMDVGRDFYLSTNKICQESGPHDPLQEEVVPNASVACNSAQVQDQCVYAQELALED